MVILQFNKLIRNKWIWGAFAVAISAFFAFDFLLDDIRTSGEEGRGLAGRLAGEEVDAKAYSAIVDEIRGFGNQRDWQTDEAVVNRQAWETYAALHVAGKLGIEATDGEVRSMIERDPTFQVNGVFSFPAYERLLRENGLTAERFEASLRRRLTQMRVTRAVLGSAAWASPMEVDRALADMTDVLTVRVATFSQDAKAAAAVKVDDAGLRKWYDEHVKELELPERIRLRLLKFDATNPMVLAKMSVTEDEMLDRYDATLDKYTSTGTNGVEVVKKFEEVKPEIERELRRLAAVTYFETNLNYQAFAVEAAKGASRLDEIAAKENLKVTTSGWFAPDGAFQEGFMSRPYQICPGAQNFREAVAELGSDRYAIVLSDRAVWLIEKAETSPKHVPSFDEAKSAIRSRALRDAKAEAFKASVEAVVRKGREAVLAAKNVSTNLTFSVFDLAPNTIPDQISVARAASSLKKGEVSPFTLVSTGKAIVVVCEDRKEGDVAKTISLKSRIQGEVPMLAENQLPALWRQWNLERLGFEPGEISSVEKLAVEE